jgi:hypothetical protein
LWSSGAACRSAGFAGTKRVVGRATASQIAPASAASAASVLPRFTQGFT